MDSFNLKRITFLSWPKCNGKYCLQKKKCLLAFCLYFPLFLASSTSVLLSVYQFSEKGIPFPAPGKSWFCELWQIPIPLAGSGVGVCDIDQFHRVQGEKCSVCVCVHACMCACVCVHACTCVHACVCVGEVILRNIYCS